MYPAFNNEHKEPPSKGSGGTYQYWSAVDPVVADVVRAMDAADTWHLEGEQKIRAALDQLIEKFQQSPIVARFSIDHPEKVVELLGWMRTSSAMMLLHYSTDDRREVLDLFVNACTEMLKARPNDDGAQRAASVAIERFLAFERIALLGRLFSPERARIIEKAVADAVRIVDLDFFHEGRHA